MWTPDLTSKQTYPVLFQSVDILDLIYGGW